MELPELKEYQWVTIGAGGLRAVVSKVYADTTLGNAEVVYLQGSGKRAKAINDDIRWADNRWEFVHQGPNGGYADRKPRLASFVAMLHEGK